MSPFFGTAATFHGEIKRDSDDDDDDEEEYDTDCETNGECSKVYGLIYFICLDRDCTLICLSVYVYHVSPVNVA